MRSQHTQETPDGDTHHVRADIVADYCCNVVAASHEEAVAKLEHALQHLLNGVELQEGEIAIDLVEKHVRFSPSMP